MKLGIGLPNTLPHETDRTLMLDWARTADEAGFDVLGTIDKPRGDGREAGRGDRPALGREARARARAGRQAGRLRGARRRVPGPLGTLRAPGRSHPRGLGRRALLRP